MKTTEIVCRACDCKSYGEGFRVHYVNKEGNCAGCSGYLTEEQKQSGTKIINRETEDELKPPPELPKFEEIKHTHTWEQYGRLIHDHFTALSKYILEKSERGSR